MRASVALYALAFFFFFAVAEAQVFSVPTTVTDVTTFDTCFAVDEPIRDVVCLPNETAPVTAIRLTVIPGQDDLAGDNALVFFAFPQPLSAVPQNSVSTPQSTSCDSGDPTQNCTVFVSPATQVAGPIVIQIQSGYLVSRYTLVKTSLDVAYCYLDHDKAILNCLDDVSNAEDQPCDKASADNSCTDEFRLLNPWRYTNSGEAKGDSNDPTFNCRGDNNDALGQFQNLGPSFEYVFPRCFGCSTFISNTYSSANCADTGPSSLASYYTTRGSLCPIPASTSVIPQTTSGVYENGNQMLDTQAVMPFYYWCWANAFQLNSDDICAFSVAAKPNQNDVGALGNYYDVWTEWRAAYDCTISNWEFFRDIPDLPPFFAGTCNQIISAAYADSANQVCCEEGGGCPTTDTGNTEGLICNGTATSQVMSAVRFLTSSCTAGDTQEARYPHGTDEVKPWSCPGDYNQFIRPERREAPFWLGRCSAACSSRPSVTQALKDPDSTSADKNFVIEGILHDKGTIEMGGPACDVYQIDPVPHSIVNISVFITAPDGERIVQHLGTDQRSFISSNLSGVKFSTRINRIQLVTGNTGRYINGLIVVCGIRDETEDFNSESTCAQGEYQPFNDPEFNLGGQTRCPIDTGVLRGIFPSEIRDGEEIPGDPTVNPWPRLIQKMAKDRALSCGCDADGCPFERDEGCTNLEGEALACAMPYWKYLSILNCGRRVGWYYVNEINQANYGNNCGQLGFRNDFVSTNGAATFVCQQGDNTCTPGFGTPRYGTTGTSFVRSPCQELGRIVKFTLDTADPDLTNGTFCKWKDRNQPQNLPPGFGWDDLPTESQDVNIPLGSQVPNMWIDGVYMYRQPSTAQQGLMTVDMEIYTDTFFGGSVASFTDGNLSWTNTSYCSSPINTEGGTNTVLKACNTNPFSGGNYRIAMQCSAPDPDFVVAVEPPVTDIFQIAAGSCEFVGFTIPVTGPLQASTFICTATLQTGGIGFQPLFATTFSCAATVPEIITFSGRSILGPTGFSCGKFDLFCNLSNKSFWFRLIFYFWLGFFLLISIFYAIAVAWYIYNFAVAQETMNTAVKQAFLVQAYKEKMEGERTAAIVGQEIQEAAALAAFLQQQSASATAPVPTTTVPAAGVQAPSI